MFGYITAPPSLQEENEAAARRYAGCYCGLCRSLSKRHGLIGRLTLTYDMTFLVLLLSSLYEPEEEAGADHCPVHPFRRRPWWRTEFTDYAADLNLLLTWWNCMDDWEDDRRLDRRLLALLIGKKCRRLEQQYSRQSEVIRQKLSELHRYEDGAEVSADRAAACFGDLMGELFVYRENDYWSPVLRELGRGMGRFIYIMDACIDYRSDLRRHRPNPLRALGTERSRESDRALLTMLLGDCTQAFEHLPLVQDVDVMRSILYSGVWLKYQQAFAPRRRLRLPGKCGMCKKCKNCRKCEDCDTSEHSEKRQSECSAVPGEKKNEE